MVTVATALLQCNSIKHPHESGILDHATCSAIVQNFALGAIAHAGHNNFQRGHTIRLFRGFTDTMITDFTAGQENLCFTEIGPYALNPLYSNIASYFNYIGVHESFLSKPYKVT